MLPRRLNQEESPNGKQECLYGLSIGKEESEAGAREQCRWAHRDPVRSPGTCADGINNG